MNDKLREFWLKVRLFWSKARYAIIPLVTLMCLYQAGVALTLLPQFSSVQYTLSKTLNREIDALSISIDGNYYGTVESQKAVQTAWGDAIERIIQETGVNYKIDSVYRLSDTKARSSQMTTNEALADAFYNYIKDQIQYYSFVGYSVHIDESVFVLRSEAEVLRFFELLASDALEDTVASVKCTSFSNGEPCFDITWRNENGTEYETSFNSSTLDYIVASSSAPEQKDISTQFVGIAISGEKGYQTIYVREEDVLTAEEAYQMCVSPALYETNYTILRGDTVKSVLKAFNMTIEQFCELNPSYSAKSTLYAGRVLRVYSSEKRVVAYQVYRRIQKTTFSEPIVYTYDSTKEAAYSKTIKNGSDGVAVVDEFVFFADGQETETRVIGETIIVAAVAEERLVGSKSTPAFIWPAEGYVGSRFGAKRAGGTHKGVDIINKPGTYVFAAQTGVILKAEWSSTLGWVICLEHNNRIYTEYAHCAKLLVSVGDHVEQGQVIALMGNTGSLATGTHLHFTVVDYSSGTWTYLDPERFLSGR